MMIMTSHYEAKLTPKQADGRQQIVVVFGVEENVVYSHSVAGTTTTLVRKVI